MASCGPPGAAVGCQTVDFGAQLCQCAGDRCNDPSAADEAGRQWCNIGPAGAYVQAQCGPGVQGCMVGSRQMFHV